MSHVSNEAQTTPRPGKWAEARLEITWFALLALLVIAYAAARHEGRNLGFEQGRLVERVAQQHASVADAFSAGVLSLPKGSAVGRGMCDGILKEQATMPCSTSMQADALLSSSSPSVRAEGELCHARLKIKAACAVQH